jgi:hypothetical protein
MLKGASDDRQIADMIRVAESQAVIDEVRKTPEFAGSVPGGARAVPSVRAERIGGSDLVRVSLRTRDWTDARTVSDMLALAFIRQWEAAGRGAGTIRIVQSGGVGYVDTLGKMITAFLYGWPVLLLAIGLEIGYGLGRGVGKRWQFMKKG